jgi:hypothetical protein
MPAPIRAPHQVLTILRWSALIISGAAVLLCAVSYAVTIGPAKIHVSSGRLRITETSVPAPITRPDGTVTQPPYVQRITLAPVVGWSVLSLAIPIFLWMWVRPHIPPGHCQACGYDLHGNRSGVCPECGAAVDRAADSTT